MATLYSEQLQPAVNPGNGLNNGLTDVFAHTKTNVFSRNITDAVNGAPVNGDTIVLCRLDKGYRSLGGQIAYTAMGAGVTFALTLVGQVSGTTLATLLTATSVAAAGKTFFGDTVAGGFGYQLAEPCNLVLTVGGANPAAGQSFIGLIDTTGN